MYNMYDFIEKKSNQNLRLRLKIRGNINKIPLSLQIRKGDKYNIWLLYIILDFYESLR